eukprot:TRINITY_DN16731_c0_g1_i1.p1 TRINITY_DN16731_c0_g1~~TRINITY_DN16731_c0_g1_i1.p1  ORF type:complete len:1023 (-),score=159.30 TRINITY_DN16731_c0_g1_i1:29-2881(-)
MDAKTPTVSNLFSRLSQQKSLSSPSVQKKTMPKYTVQGASIDGNPSPKNQPHTPLSQRAPSTPLSSQSDPPLSQHTTPSRSLQPPLSQTASISHSQLASPASSSQRIPLTPPSQRAPLSQSASPFRPKPASLIPTELREKVNDDTSVKSQQSPHPALQSLPSTPKTPQGKSSLNKFRTPKPSNTTPITGKIVGHHYGLSSVRSSPRPNIQSPLPAPVFQTPQKRSAPSINSDSARKKRKITYGVNQDSSSTTTSTQKAPSNRDSMFNLEKKEGRISLREFAVMQCGIPGRYSKEHLKAYGLNEEVIYMTSTTASQFKFRGLDTFSQTSVLGDVEMFELLISAGAKPAKGSFDQGWVTNHYRWIVWKLASMERSYPRECAGQMLTPERVLAQLKYRYERDVNLAHRSIIKKVLEKDDTPSRHMVLLVAGIKDSLGELAVVEVTDGWYCVCALLDPLLSKALQSGKIKVGQKLHVYGAKLSGNEQGCTPLELDPDNPTIMLKLFVNATRRARWWTTLGAQKNPSFVVSLSSVKSNGGIIPCLDLCVERVFPMVFSEVFKNPEDEEQVFRLRRSTFGEENALRVYTQKRQDFMMAKEAEVIGNIEKEEKQEIRKWMQSKPGRLRDDETDSEVLFQHFRASSDPDGFMHSLDCTQSDILRREIERHEINKNERIRREIDSALHEQDSQNRKVTSCVRLRVSDWPTQQVLQAKKKIIGEANLFIYDADESLIQDLVEGGRIQVFSSTPQYRPAGNSTPSNSIVDITAHKSTLVKFLNTPYIPPPPPQKHKYVPRQILSTNQLSESLYGKFVDLVGISLSVSAKQLSDETPSNHINNIPRKLVQYIQFTDTSGELGIIHIIRIEDDFPPPSIFAEGKRFYVMNAQYKHSYQNKGMKVHVFYVTEISELGAFARKPLVHKKLDALAVWQQENTERISACAEAGKALFGLQTEKESSI